MQFSLVECGFGSTKCESIVLIVVVAADNRRHYHCLASQIAVRFEIAAAIKRGQLSVDTVDATDSRAGQSSRGVAFVLAVFNCNGFRNGRRWIKLAPTTLQAGDSYENQQARTNESHYLARLPLK